VGEVPLIFLSGMAADERLFESQLTAFPRLQVQPWIPPLSGETLQAYAARLARLVNPGEPCLVGGASFGGMVALEMATHLPVLGCILIGSLRSPSGLPWKWRLLRPVALLGPEGFRVLAGMVARLGRPMLRTRTTRRLRRLSQPESAFVRWAMCAVLRWSPSPATQQVRVFHIHGSADHIFPVERARPDLIIPGGSHALSLFSAKAVNEFIAGVVNEVS
jgi:pimeloyl-ACP methyl ester carboxylesterase